MVQLLHMEEFISFGVHSRHFGSLLPPQTKMHLERAVQSGEEAVTIHF